MKCGVYAESVVYWKDGSYIYACEKHEKEIRKLCGHFEIPLRIETMGKMRAGCGARGEEK